MNGPLSQKVSFDICLTYSPVTYFVVPNAVGGSVQQAGATLAPENHLFQTNVSPIQPGDVSNVQTFPISLFDKHDKIYVKRARLSSWVYGFGAFIAPDRPGRVSDTEIQVLTMWDDGSTALPGSADNRAGIIFNGSMLMNEWRDTNRWISNPAAAPPSLCRGKYLAFRFLANPITVVFPTTPAQLAAQPFVVSMELELAHSLPMVWD